MATSRQSIVLAIVAGLLMATVVPAAAFVSNCAGAQNLSFTVYNGNAKSFGVRQIFEFELGVEGGWQL